MMLHLEVKVPLRRTSIEYIETAEVAAEATLRLVVVAAV